MKTVNENKETKEGNDKLKECLSLWKSKAKSGLDYLSGKLSKDLGEKRVVAYYNTNKKNPKEPDIRIYAVIENLEQLEVASLWSNLSKNNVEYFTGVTNDKEKLVGFINVRGTEENKQPYLQVYFR